MNNAKNIYIVEYEFLDGPYPEDYCGYNTIYADTNIDKALVEFNKKFFNSFVARLLCFF